MSKIPLLMFRVLKFCDNPFKGNYFGAVKGWAESLEPSSGQSVAPDSKIFAIVDLHAITLPQKPGNYCKPLNLY
jgi:hypothetical protein